MNSTTTPSAHARVIARTSLSRARSVAIWTVEPPSGTRITAKNATITKTALRRSTARFSAVAAGVTI